MATALQFNPGDDVISTNEAPLGLRGWRGTVKAVTPDCITVEFHQSYTVAPGMFLLRNTPCKVTREFHPSVLVPFKTR